MWPPSPTWSILVSRAVDAVAMIVDLCATRGMKTKFKKKKRERTPLKLSYKVSYIGLWVKTHFIVIKKS